MHFSIIYYPFTVNSQYLRTWGVDNLEVGTCSEIIPRLLSSYWNQKACYGHFFLLYYITRSNCYCINYHLFAILKGEKY